jgi:hypothetical protein
LRSILGSYNKSNLDTTPTTPYIGRIDDAIRRAKKLHPDPQQNWPLTLGSHVYRVVEMIQQAMSDKTKDEFIRGSVSPLVYIEQFIAICIYHAPTVGKSKLAKMLYNVVTDN